MTIQHFPAPPGIKAPPLSFAARSGDLLFISGIPGFDAQGIQRDRFGDEVTGPGANRGDGDIQVAIAGEHNDRKLGPSRAQLSAQLDAAHARQVDIRNHDAEVLGL